MRVRIESIGCRLNIGEAESLARALAAAGHAIVGPGEPADLIVFNTCAVTHVAARKSRKLIRQWRRDDPGATVVATGCYAELSAADVRDAGVDLVVGNQEKDDLPTVLAHHGLLRGAQTVPAPDATPLPLQRGDCRTRAFVKVQDGCDNRCTFCIVTVARGDSRSRSIEEVVTEIRGLVALGYREAVLSGVHLGSYGHERGEPNGLEQLVRAVLHETPIERLRLSSLEPWDLQPGLFRLWGDDPRLLPHFHLPLQSGCDATLRRMARRTDQTSFARLLASARDAVDDLSITTDVIVGFPGETGEEFNASFAFIERMGFAKLHVFRYSPRDGTAAATMPDQVAPPIAQERSRRMHALGAELENRFRRRYLGRTLAVLWESFEERPEGRRWSGLTGNFQRVVTEEPVELDLANVVTATRIVDARPGALCGVPASDETRLAV